jgi:hypothetical protein
LIAGWCPEEKAVLLVVDCDSHVVEPADLWQTHLEPKYRDRAIRIERREGVEHLIIGEESVLSGVLAGLGGAHLDRKEVFAPGMTYADGCEPASYDPAARAAMLDAWGVDVGVLFPTIGILPFPTEDERTIGAMLERVGEDKILWRSDFPHVDSTLEAPSLIRHSVAGLSPQRQAAVLGENARRVFGL